MSKPSLINSVFAEVRVITAKLIEEGLAVDYNFPCKISIGKGQEISWSSQSRIAPQLKASNYEEIYKYVIEQRNFSFLLNDGGVLQLLYRFDHKDNLISHRLAYLPNPYSRNLADPLIIGPDEDSLNIVEKPLSILPIRFEYSNDESFYKEYKHPYSHIHLGDIEDCRIPLRAPTSPNLFIDFILRNFYTEFFYKTFQVGDLKVNPLFSDTISSNESKILHASFNY